MDCDDPGLFCDEGVCRSVELLLPCACADDADCPDPLICVDHAFSCGECTEAECAVDSDCGDGVCVNRFCHDSFGVCVTPG